MQAFGRFQGQLRPSGQVRGHGAPAAAVPQQLMDAVENSALDTLRLLQLPLGLHNRVQCVQHFHQSFIEATWEGNEVRSKAN